MKEQMIKDMTAKVNQVLEAKDAVEAVLDSIEELKAEGKEAVAKLEKELQDQQEALTMAQDLGEGKLIKGQIDALAENIELQKAVNVGKRKAKYRQLEDKAEEMFKTHKSAVFFFRTVDNYFINNTTLATLSENKETMTDFSQALSNAFASVRQVILDEGIVANENQNRVYKGIHLGQVAQDTELSTFEFEVRPYLNKLKQAGKLA